MAISNIPTFTDGEILSASKLNQLGTAVSTKFSGNITGADLVWPLVAQGNIDMGSAYSLANLRTLWDVVNVAEYDTVADAIAALPSGGGCLFIPPGTVTADGNEIDTSNTLVLGAGRGSVLKLTSGSTSGYLMRTSAGLSNIGFANLTIDGNSETGSGQDGIRILDVDGVSVHGVHFRNFSGTHLVLTNSGTAGNPCENVNVTSCHFEGGGGDQLLLEDVDGVHIIGCHFENPTTKGIHGDPDASASFMRSILIQGCSISNALKAIRIVGASGTASNNWRLVRIIGNEVVSDAATAITCGITSGVVKESIVLDNVLLSLTGDGIHMCAETGLVSRNVVPSSGADGADISGSSDVSVLNNDFHDAGAVGVDLSDTTDCTVVGNNLSGATTSALSTTNATGQHISSNIGALAPTVKTAYGSAPDETTPAAASGTYSESVTIPAGTITVGSVIRVRAHAVHSGTGDDSTFFVSLGGENSQAVTVNSANDANGDWVFVVTSLSGAGSTAGSLQGMAEAATNVVFCANSTLAVDWTADVAVEIKWTKSNTGNGLLLNTFSVEINGG